MNSSLIQCPACSKQVSAQAVSCIQCGHPLKAKSNAGRSVGLVLGTAFLAAIALAAYKFDMHAGWSQKQNTMPVNYVQVDPVTPTMSERELALELQAFTLRANRSLPHKPNPLLTLQRIHYKPKPNRLTYDYELNAAAGMAGVDLRTVRPALMNRYCNHEDFAMPASNGVPVTWRYLDLGRVVHEETIHGCDMNVASR